ncbi:unnamed protein product, partial [Cladocopium goreaui]
MEMQQGSERLACEGSPTGTTRTASNDFCSRSAGVNTSSKGLNFVEAVMVSFNSGLGPTLSVVAYAAMLSGSVGFLFVLFVATVTAIVEQQTLMRASVECNATTFQELCQRTPAWARQTTIWSGLIYLWACGGFYFDFLEAFFEGQLCPLLCASNGDVWLCQSRWSLSLPILLMIYVVCSPAELSGRLARGINITNMFVKTLVIAAAILKGFLTWRTKTETTSYVTWRPIGFFRVTSILMSSLANTGILPQLAADVQPALREKVTTWCPAIAVSMQSSVYVVVALVGYAALGSAVDLDLFKIYEEKYPDVLTSILQGSMALMIYFNLPLAILPCKSQVWNFFSADVSLAEAPWAMQVALTLFFSLSSIAVPTLIGDEAFGNLILTVASTTGVWMNLLLPAVILIYSRAPSDGRERHVWLMKVAWIVLLGVLCLIDGIIQMLEPQSSTRDPKLAQAKKPTSNGFRLKVGRFLVKPGENDAGFLRAEL